MKLALGTAQFGLSYGISNTRGQTPEAEARAIMDAATREGLDVVDTAPAYGDSESVLGRILPDRRIRVVTKTPHFASEEITANDVLVLERSLASSLSKLGCDAVYGLLVHGASDVLKPGGQRLVSAVERLRDRGCVLKVGVSAYTGAEVDAILDRFPIDLIQVPLSAVDQRMISGGQLTRLKTKGVEIHTRSAFLQGLLLLDPESRPARFSAYSSVFQRFRDIAGELRLRPTEAALAFACSVPEVDHVVCGVNSLAQWHELVEAARIRVDLAPFLALRCDDPNLVDPTRWDKVF